MNVNADHTDTKTKAAVWERTRRPKLSDSVVQRNKGDKMPHVGNNLQLMRSVLLKLREDLPKHSRANWT